MSRSKTFTFNLWTMFGVLYSLTTKLMIHFFIASSALPLSDQEMVKRESKDPRTYSVHSINSFIFCDLFSPLGHSQWKELILSMHLPLLRQGWLAHSSVLMWQNTPSYPEIPQRHGDKRVISPPMFPFLP